MEWKIIKRSGSSAVRFMLLGLIIAGVAGLGCKKDDAPKSTSFRFVSLDVNGVNDGFEYKNINSNPVIRITFSEQIDSTSIGSSVFFRRDSDPVQLRTQLENNNSTLVITAASALQGFSKYHVAVTNNLKSAAGAPLEAPVNISLTTTFDSTDKFERIDDDALLTLVQQQTFRYFWDFAHPGSGLARERNTSGDVVTSGGSGFGIMAILAAVHRGFISRADALTRLQKIVAFLKDEAETFHGAYPHWLNGETGEAIAFSEKDNGADLVETSFLIQGLLSARQFFTTGDATEATLRSDIDSIWHRVEWDWFTRGEDVLYWHWSPDYEWEMNHPIRGWNECLITYVLAASSPTHPVTKAVYYNGWARQGGMANNGVYYGTQLPLGPAYGGPLFFAHYSFLGINPFGLKDAYADYGQQNTAHTLINYQYCVDNPENHAGYSSSIWGLTASDNDNGYSAHSPENDLGVIAPTAAISSMPYAPEQSMEALRFFYYKLGDKLWNEYGFVDAFNLNTLWVANSFLAIDQGPIIIMIENHRSGLLWNVFMSSPEVKSGMQQLGFSSPNL